MSTDYIYHEETYEHKNGLKYNVRWFFDHDFGSPLENGDGYGVTERMEWNPTDEEQLEQHLLDYEPELEEETRLRLMRVISRASNRWDKGLYYDVLSSLHKAKTEWGITDHDKAVEAVERDYAYLKGWYDDDWQYLTISVAPLDEDGEPIEDDREYCGGYESTLVNNAEERAYVEEAIEDRIWQIEHFRKQRLHKGQLELSFT
jgi:hypothetical protein